MDFFKITAEHCAAAAKTEAACLGTAWSESQISEAAENEAYLYLAAVENGFICGVASAVFSIDSAFIVNVAVLPELRRRGIALKLLRLLEEEALKRGCIKIVLEAASRNAAAIALYERRGFKRTGMRKGLFPKSGDDGVVMVKELV